MNDREAFTFSDEVRPIVDMVLARLGGSDRGHFRRILLFGSAVGEAYTAESDLDLLVVIEPPWAHWSFQDNIKEARRLEKELIAVEARVDLWVRTIDHFEEARGVIGGLEYSADKYGVEIHSAPASRKPWVRRGQEEIWHRNVCDWLELSRRLLGRAAMLHRLPADHAERAASKSPGHYALRATLAAIGAVLVWHKVEPPPRRLGLAHFLHLTSAADPRAVKQMRLALGPGDVTLTSAHAVLRAVVTHIASDRRFLPIVQMMVRYLAVPTLELRDVPPLKLRPVHSTGESTRQSLKA